MENSILFVTNLSHEDRDEDLYLIDRLAGEHRLVVADPVDAVDIVCGGQCHTAVIRNAWPSRDFQDGFDRLEALVEEGRLETYNPPSASRGFREDKRYLARLYEKGFPVIPTWTSKETVRAAKGDLGLVLYKPLDAGSSTGIEAGSLDDLPDHGGIYQPEVEFLHEVSLYYVDGAFSHAMRTLGAGHDCRWDLVEFKTSEDDMAWGRRFVDWNAQPYGIQRIDGARTPDGSLLLMEVEDFLPYLSLLALPQASKRRVTDDLIKSIGRFLEHGPSARAKAAP